MVRSQRDTVAALRKALATITADAMTRDLAWSPALEPAASPPPATQTADRPEGNLRGLADGTFTRITLGTEQPHPVPRTQAGEPRALLSLRDTADALLDAEAQTSDDTAELQSLRGKLNRQYDSYLATYGPLNRYTVRRTGRTDPESGEPVMARVQPPHGGFRIDPLARWSSR